MSANKTIPQHFPRIYSINFEHLLQQRRSKLSPFTTPDNFEGKSKDFNQMGESEFQAIIGRGTDTVITDTPTGKRRLTMGAYDKTSLLDEWDPQNLGPIENPKGETQQSHMFGWNRLTDAIICTAALADVVVPSINELTGVETTTTVALPSSQKIAIDYVETGSPANSGLTVGKLRQANFMFDDAEIDDEEERVIAVTAQDLKMLLRATEIGSADYNEVKALYEGTVKHFMGFTFERVSSRRVLPAVSGVRKLPAFVRSGIKKSETNVRVYTDVRSDKRHALQIRHAGMIGAVRMEEPKVVEIAVDSTLA